LKLLKQCKTCEFNFDGICTGDGDKYSYGEKILDETKGCNDWNSNQDYFTYIITNAPRFLLEPYNDCRISYDELISLLGDYSAGNAISINIFDAVKFIYGISMIDIAVILNVSFGVVYRAKTRGIPSKRIKQFSDVLGITPNLLVSTTTKDFGKLQQAKETFFSRPNIERSLNTMPEWKQTLAYNISSSYLYCPIHFAKDFARVDKLYWRNQMPMNGYTVSEEKMIAFITRDSKKHQPVDSFDYSLDIAGIPRINATTTVNSNG